MDKLNKYFKIFYRLFKWGSVKYFILYCQRKRSSYACYWANWKVNLEILNWKELLYTWVKRL